MNDEDRDWFVHAYGLVMGFRRPEEAFLLPRCAQRGLRSVCTVVWTGLDYRCAHASLC